MVNIDKALHVKVKTARGRRPSSTRWLQRQLNDPYVKQAKFDGYRSRAAYKLIEINDKFQILKPGICVVDLGAAPGGFTQIAASILNSLENRKSKIVAVDLLPMEPIPGATCEILDFLSENADKKIIELLGGRKADVVITDMAAPTTGHSSTDHIRIMLLCEEAFHFACQVLAPNGSFVAKIFKGGTENELLTLIKQNFKTVKHFKPKSSRQESSEAYVIAKGYKGDIS